VLDVACRLDEVARAPEAVLFVQLRHLLDRQPFRKRDSTRVDVAAHQQVDDLERSHRAIEPILSSLEIASLPGPPERGAEEARVAHDLCVREAASNRSACGPLPDHDELLWSAVPLVRLVNIVPPKPAGKRRRATGEHNDEGNQREDLTHGHQDNPAG
jgi:hypothetical protein